MIIVYLYMALEKAIEELQKQFENGYVDYNGKIIRNISEKTIKDKIANVTAFCKRNGNISDVDDLDYIVLTILMSNVAETTKVKSVQIWRQISKQKMIKSKAIRRKYLEIVENVKGTETLKENKPNEKENNVLNKVNYQMLKNAVNYKNINQEQMLYNLIIDVNETPRLAYRTLKLFDCEIKGENCLVVNQKEVKIVLVHYKTAKRYGKWNIRIKGQMRTYVKACVKQMGKKDGDVVFANKKGEIMSSSKFSEMISRVVKKKIGVSVNNTIIRKIKEMHLFHRNPLFLSKSLKEKEKWVIQNFRHDINTANLWYNKIKYARTDATS